MNLVKENIVKSTIVIEKQTPEECDQLDKLAEEHGVIDCGTSRAGVDLLHDPDFMKDN